MSPETVAVLVACVACLVSVASLAYNVRTYHRQTGRWVPPKPGRRPGP